MGCQSDHRPTGIKRRVTDNDIGSSGENRYLFAGKSVIPDKVLYPVGQLLFTTPLGILTLAGRGD
jgi:hypothetical protein